MGAPGYCVFGIQGGLDPSLNIFIFGDVFLRSFYSIYDFESKRIGLALHKYSSGSIETDSKAWAYVIIAVSAGVVVACIVGYCVMKKRQAARERERQENDEIGTALAAAYVVNETPL